MDQQEFEHMIQDTDYHFFVLSCPAIIPFNLALHTRIVVVHPGGKTVRWELGHFKNKEDSSLWYIHKDFLSPRQWISKYFWPTKKHFESKLLYHCSGNWDSIPYKMVSSLDEIIQKYPYKQQYRLVWHNSNFFTQWILNHFPEMKFTLPRNAIGK